MNTYYKNMKRTIVALGLLAALHSSFAQEKLSLEDSLPYARTVSADTRQLNGTPLATEVDADQPVVITDDPYGGMVLPQKNLKVEAIAQAGETAVPVGQLWLRRLTPMNEGEPVAQDRLRLVTVRSQGEEVTAPQCALGVRRNAGGKLELLVYGKGREPVLTVALKPLDATQSAPLDLEAERDGDAGKLTLKILGKYQATMSVTELDI